MRIRVSAGAAADLTAAFQFINRDNPRAARAVRSAIRRAILSLGEFPNRGRPSALTAARELPVAGGPYVVVYAIGREEVIILRIRHTSQGPLA